MLDDDREPAVAHGRDGFCHRLAAALPRAVTPDLHPRRGKFAQRAKPGKRLCRRRRCDQPVDRRTQAGARTMQQYPQMAFGDL
jgi:hypothetical protein